MMNIQEFKERVEHFLIHLEVEKNLAPNTIRSYAGDLHQFISFWSQMVPAQQKALTIRQIIERYLVSLFYKKMDKSSIARKFSCFKSFEKFLRAQGIILHLKLQRPRLDKKLPLYLSVEEINHLLDTVSMQDLPTKKPIRDTAIFELLYATGIRCSELTAIKIKDLDLLNKTIRIWGKGRKERIVLFGLKAQTKLQHYLTKERRATKSDLEPLFINSSNAPLTSRTIQRIIAMFRKFLTLDRRITPHKLRHSFATHLLNQGADLRMVQELLGHKTLSSTEKYTHVSLEELARMCNTIHPINTLKKDPE